MLCTFSGLTSFTRFEMFTVGEPRFTIHNLSPAIGSCVSVNLGAAMYINLEFSARLTSKG